MKKKVLLDYGFEERFYAVLMQSQQLDYQLALSLNRQLHVEFKRLPELMAFHPTKKETLPHTLYGWISSNGINYFLIISSEKSSTLLSEAFLLIEKREHKESVERLIEKIAAFDFIFSVEKITAKQRQLAEQLNHLAIDLEEHFDNLNKTLKYQNPKE